ncbi:MAG: tetratricopeptide repeat protein [Pseudomonadota bacterium]
MAVSAPAASDDKVLSSTDDQADPPVVEKSGYAPQTLDDFFAVLSAAPDEPSAKAAEAQIWRMWNESGSVTVDLLMQRARSAMNKKSYSRALQILDSVIELDPEYAEGWNRRATVHFLMENFGESLGDIQRTIALEPRHFGAISGMAMIFQRIGDDEAALEAYRRVLSIHPFMGDAEKAVEDLADDVEGRGI